MTDETVFEIPREVALEMDVKIEHDKLVEMRKKWRETKRELDAMTQRAEAAEAKLAANTAKLQKLYYDVNEVCAGVDPKAIRGAVNWADLGCVEAAMITNQEGSCYFRVQIEEAAPGEQPLIHAIRDGLAARGWDVTQIFIETEW